MPSRSFTPGRRQLTALRLSALDIAAPAAESPVAAVRHLLALQAQDYAGALWSIGLRTPVPPASVEAAHHAGDIVRSWPFRSTLHFVAAEDLGWMLALAGRVQTDIVPGNNGMFLSTIVAGGEIVGTWRRAVRAIGVEVATQPWRDLSATTRRGVERAAARYAEYLGLPLLAVG